MHPDMLVVEKILTTVTQLYQHTCGGTVYLRVATARHTTNNISNRYCDAINHCQTPRLQLSVTEKHEGEPCAVHGKCWVIPKYCQGGTLVFCWKYWEFLKCCFLFDRWACTLTMVHFWNLQYSFCWLQGWRQALESIYLVRGNRASIYMRSQCKYRKI